MYLKMHVCNIRYDMYEEDLELISFQFIHHAAPIPTVYLAGKEPNANPLFIYTCLLFVCDSALYKNIFCCLITLVK